jgi:hypothetical protein
VRRFFKGSERQRRMYAHDEGKEVPVGAQAGDRV